MVYVRKVSEEINNQRKSAEWDLPNMTPELMHLFQHADALCVTSNFSWCSPHTGIKYKNKGGGKGE